MQTGLNVTIKPLNMLFASMLAVLNHCCSDDGCLECSECDQFCAQESKQVVHVESFACSVQLHK